MPIYNEGDALTNKILNGQDLTDKEELSVKRMTQVFSILSSHERNTARRIISRMLDIPKTSIDYWIRKSEDFFGGVNGIRIESERIRQKMRLEALLFDPRTTVQDKIKIEKLLMELLGTNKAQAQEEKRKRPVFVFHQYTTDPSVLQEEEEPGQYKEVE